SILRLAENARDTTSALRVLQLLDGFGPAHTKRAIGHLAQHHGELRSLDTFVPPPAGSEQWARFVQLMRSIAGWARPLPEREGKRVSRFYKPFPDRSYDKAEIQKRDRDQREQISPNSRSRSVMLAEPPLDPPASTQDLAGPSSREEDYLILSTIHSAKGCEWD